MKLALLSDTHDRREVVKKVVAMFPGLGVTHILHTGDLVSSWMFEILEPDSYPTWYVFGNNEDQHDEIIETAQNLGITVFLDVGEFELDGKKIACTHYPRVAESLAAFGSFDLVVHGHSHKKILKKLPTGGYLVNPGTAGGERGPASFAVYDTSTHIVEFVDVDVHQKVWSFE